MCIIELLDIMHTMESNVIFIDEVQAGLKAFEPYIAMAQQVRRKVFVEGQGVSEAIDFDGKDTSCAHLVLTAGEEAVGTLRIRKTGEGTKLERIAVLESYRGQKFGELLVRCALSLVSGPVYLHAQVRSEGFYQKLGFVAEDPTIYYEADIAHRTMIWPSGQGVAPCTITRLS